MLGALLPARETLLGVSPASIAIVVVWAAGLYIIERVRRAPRWQVSMPGSAPGRPHRRVRHPSVKHPFAERRTATIVLVFAAGSMVTLLAGVALTQSGGALADRAGISGVLFGATVLSVASALPEIATGIAAARLGDNQLVMGDIFGGNAFQVCLFLVADIIAGRSVLSQAGAANSWLAGLGILVTLVYAAGVIIRPQKDILRVGADSLVVLAMIVIGIIGLTRIPV